MTEMVIRGTQLKWLSDTKLHVTHDWSGHEIKHYTLHKSEMVTRHKTSWYIFSNYAYDRGKPHVPQADNGYDQTKPLAQLVWNRVRIQQGIVYDDQ